MPWNSDEIDPLLRNHRERRCAASIDRFSEPDQFLPSHSDYLGRAAPQFPAPKCLVLEYIQDERQVTILGKHHTPGSE